MRSLMAIDWMSAIANSQSLWTSFADRNLCSYRKLKMFACIPATSIGKCLTRIRIVDGITLIIMHLFLHSYRQSRKLDSLFRARLFSLWGAGISHVLVHGKHSPDVTTLTLVGCRLGRGIALSHNHDVAALSGTLWLPMPSPLSMLANLTDDEQHHADCHFAAH